MGAQTDDVVDEAGCGHPWALKGSRSPGCALQVEKGGVWELWIRGGMVGQVPRLDI